MSEGVTSADWIGGYVRTRTNADEEFNGTLQGATEHGVVIERRLGDKQVPMYYSWSVIAWMRPRENPNLPAS